MPAYRKLAGDATIGCNRARSGGCATPRPPIQFWLPPARHPATSPFPTRRAASLAAALATPEVRRLAAARRGDLAGLRDRALPLLDYAAALRRSELAAVEREHLRFTVDGLELLLLAATAA